ncbi:MAG: 1-deoxy-D-xylulose-5-phosphate synthase [Lachnospiraceae bacterium]|nr:1-deoxy-D-xylulose-5-phosphate synthase [Lachnospiraceae bacterium]
MNHSFDLDAIRRMNESELKECAADLRMFLLEKVSRKGGHLSSNLGAVELTLALVRAFDVPNDKIIFDVGHQSYAYKAVTGRADLFDSLRDMDGLSGFPKRRESVYDAFDSGHSSNSISAAIGMAKARDLKKESYSVVSVIGDGSLTGGEAFEGLNNASMLDSGLIIILNDNGMSISRNVGGLTKGLTALRSAAGYNKVKKGVKNRLDASPLGESVIRALVNAKDSVKELIMPTGMVFENIGIKYLGPVDGHDILSMQSVFLRAKKMNRPVLIHVLTEKGKGYRLAEKHPSYFHGIGPFDLSTGRERSDGREVTYSDLFGAFMEKEADAHPEIVSVTAAMGSGVGLRSFKRWLNS